MIDLYAERLGPGLWGEPVNTLTNASFLVAAWAAWTLARRRRVVLFGVRLLVLVCVLIGLGSALFHTFATAWAMALDVLPILLFQVVFLWLYVRGPAAAGRCAASGMVLLLLAAVAVTSVLPPVLNGSLQYGPALLFLAALGWHRVRHAGEERWVLLLAAATLTVSLLFRTVDLAAAAYVPVGTHFIWHLLNGTVLYLSMRGFIVASSESSRAQPCCC